MTVSEYKSHLATHCGRWGYLIKKGSQDGLSILYGAVRCNSWLCPRCRRRKARRFASATLAYFKGRRVSHLTITDAVHLTPAESFRTFAHRWNHFRTLIARWNKDFHYVRVLEEQPGTHRAHYHILTDRFIPRIYIEQALSDAGFGKIYKIHECSDTEAFFYVRKYLTKEWKNEAAYQLVIDNNLRLVSGSHGFKLANGSPEKWEVILKLVNHSVGKRFTKTYILALCSDGARIINHNSDEFVHVFQLAFDRSFGLGEFKKFTSIFSSCAISAHREGVSDVDFDMFNRYINSQLVPAALDV